jgi:hypothetical protein
MRSWLVLLIAFAVHSTDLSAQDCRSLAAELKLPQNVRSGGNPRILRWQQVDKTLNELTRRLEGLECEFTFGELFRTGRDDVLFPLSNSVIRIAPEGTFSGLPVFTKEGHELGTYEGRVRYERSGGLYAAESYSLYYFQYRDAQEKIESVGSRLLLGDFAVPWTELVDRVAVSTR